MSLSKIVFAFGFTSLSTLAIACSGNPDGSVTDETADNVGTEELHNSICGGIAGIHCPTGYECQLTAHHPDATGKCIKAKGEGAFCGGFGGISCPKGYTCELGGNYPDASGTCHKSGNVCVQNVLCVQGSRWDGLLCQCVSQPTCLTLTCAKGYHCEMKGINGGSIGVCLSN
jgi:hypothetical protein